MKPVVFWKILCYSVACVMVGYALGIIDETRQRDQFFVGFLCGPLMTAVGMVLFRKECRP